jgi:hypothetical protein
VSLVKEGKSLEEKAIKIRARTIALEMYEKKCKAIFF